MNQGVETQKYVAIKENIQEFLPAKDAIILENDDEASLLYGNHDKNLRLIRDAFRVKLVARNGVLKMAGEKEGVEAARTSLIKLLEIIRFTGNLGVKDVEQTIMDVQNYDEGAPAQAINLFQKEMFTRPKTEGQANYIAAIRNNDLVFCIGPAGTGKTYLAVAMALSFLKSGDVKRIVLARPAVEAGEKLGYLPGDIKDKVSPYLRPLYDALADMMDVGQVKKYLDSDLIEILPLAYMRGRTLNSAFIILDEAQNCTVKQMKTFLTRLVRNQRLSLPGISHKLICRAGSYRV